MDAAKGHEANVSLEVVPGGLLLSQIRNGDAKAAEQLYHRFAGRLRQLAHAKFSKLLRGRLDLRQGTAKQDDRFTFAAEAARQCPTQASAGPRDDDDFRQAFPSRTYKSIFRMTCVWWKGD